MRAALACLMGSVGLSLLCFTLVVQGMAYLHHSAVMEVDALAIHGMVAQPECGPAWEGEAHAEACREASLEALALEGEGWAAAAGRWLTDLWLGGPAMALLLFRPDPTPSRPAGGRRPFRLSQVERRPSLRRR